MRKARTAAAAILCMVTTLVACGEAKQQQVPDDLLLLSTRSGVASVKAGGSSPTLRSDSGVPAGDWSTVVRTEWDRKDTTLVAVDPTTGTEQWRRSVPGRLRPKVVAPDGAYVALTPDHPMYAGRTNKTIITVSGRDVDRPITINLEGNFEPEAFSTDGRTLFVVQYLPAANPSRYQVRQLKVSTGVVEDVFSVDKELQEAMRGTARVQEMSADGKRLYTLYSTKTKHGEHSFIHVLSLDELWAHCIDLPHGFAMGGDAKTALDVREDGKRVYVADTASGGVVEVDTERLQVVQEASIEEIADAGRATVAIDDANDALYVAAGNRIGRMDLEDLSWDIDWEMPNRIRGLQIVPKSERLYVGQTDEIGVIDTDSGDLLDALDPPGVPSITDLGPVTPGLDPAREKIVCGC